MTWDFPLVWYPELFFSCVLYNEVSYPVGVNCQGWGQLPGLGSTTQGRDQLPGLGSIARVGVNCQGWGQLPVLGSTTRVGVN